MAPHGTLSENLVGFGCLLRAKGVGVGPGEHLDSLKALETAGVDDGDVFRNCLRLCLAKSTDAQAVFDRCFDDYWNVWERSYRLNKPVENKKRTSRRKSGEPAVVALREWLTRDDRRESDLGMVVYSPVEAESQRDFADVPEEEIEGMISLLRVVARRLALRLDRRLRPRGRRGILDLQRTLRGNLKRGGELLDLAYRRKALRPLRVVLLCDVSRSMQLYSHFLMQFMAAFQRVLPRMETFAFSTSLHRVTSALRRDTMSDVRTAVRDSAPGWNGGTRIGFCLREFLEEYGRELLSRDTAVIVVSDGWDTGEIDVLEESMRDIQKGSGRVIWLNALLGNPEYEPACRGMQVALPYIDHFGPAHNLDSLRRLAQELG